MIKEENFYLIDTENGKKRKVILSIREPNSFEYIKVWARKLEDRSMFLNHFNTYLKLKKRINNNFLINQNYYNELKEKNSASIHVGSFYFVFTYEKKLNNYSFIRYIGNDHVAKNEDLAKNLLDIELSLESLNKRLNIFQSYVFIMIEKYISSNVYKANNHDDKLNPDVVKLNIFGTEFLIKTNYYKKHGKMEIMMVSDLNSYSY